MSSALQRAQAHLDAHRAQINLAFRPRFHAAVPAGWLNDPNGFCYYNGAYHLFYQFHPYASVWGPMHWGHWTSADLVRWTEQPVAMAPDMPFDAGGCFSGTAIENDGKLLLMYTGVTEETPWGVSLQQQCIAESTDGIHLDKWPDNPVINADTLPPGASPFDFRDPKVWREGDGYRAVIASQDIGGGQLLLYRSSDLHSWSLDGVLMRGLATMAECPDLFPLGDREMLIVCLIGAGEAQPVIYATGRRDGAGFVPDAGLLPLDDGLDFYAPQTMQTPDGRRVLMGWMLSPGDVMPTHTLDHGWAGMMTLPRELTLEGGRLRQRPLAELTSLRGEAIQIQNMRWEGTLPLPCAHGRHLELDMTLRLADDATVSLHLMEDGPEYFEIQYDAATQMLRVDRERLGYPPTKDGKPEARPWRAAKVPLKEGALRLQAFVDTCSVELFAGDGEAVFSSLAFPRYSGEGVSLHAPRGAVLESLTKWELG